MAELIKVSIYLLCLTTATACFWLLLRGYWRGGARLLLWSSVCFGFLALNSLFVVIDLLVFPTIDFQTIRHAASLAAVGSLIFGLVWETD